MTLASTHPARELRIAQVAPLGTERIVSYLTDELVALGHDVTLFASGESRSRARLLSLPNVHVPLPLRDDPFDVVHFHADALHSSTTRRRGAVSVTTLHGLAPVSDDMPVVSVSQAQRAALPRASWVATIPHGLPLDLHREGDGGDYLVFLGTISPDNRVDRAIAIAEATGLKLAIAARIDGADGAYFTREIAPLMTRRCVDYLGELAAADKAALLRDARALLFPVESPGSFGLAMIESIACGTPVIAYREGAVQEVIDDGVTGFVVDDLDSAIAAVGKLGELSRHAIRARFEQRFSASRMARAYVDVYRTLLGDAPFPRVDETANAPRADELATGS